MMEISILSILCCVIWPLVPHFPTSFVVLLTDTPVLLRWHHYIVMDFSLSQDTACLEKEEWKEVYKHILEVFTSSANLDSVWKMIKGRGVYSCWSFDFMDVFLHSLSIFCLKLQRVWCATGRSFKIWNQTIVLEYIDILYISNIYR